MPGSCKRILCLHGIGGMDSDVSWQPLWRQAFRVVLPTGPADCQFLPFDDLFEAGQRRPGGIRYRDALCLIREALQEENLAGQPLHTLFRWHAGMLAQYLTDGWLRKQLCRRIRGALRHYRPQVLFGHSLGSLLAVDALGHTAIPPAPEVLVTAGSPLGHPLVLRLFPQLAVMPAVSQWIDLHNPHDRILARDSRCLSHPRFLRVTVPFRYGWLNHDALHYLLHPNACRQAWPAVTAHCSAENVS